VATFCAGVGPFRFAAAAVFLAGVSESFRFAAAAAFCASECFRFAVLSTSVCALRLLWETFAGIGSGSSTLGISALNR